MWTVVTKLVPPEHRLMTMMNKGGCHPSVAPLFGGCLSTMQNRHFSYFKPPTTNLSVPDDCQNQNSEEENCPNSSQSMPDSPKTIKRANPPNYACNTNKKKRRKKRRRRRKNRIQQKSVPRMEQPTRQRTVSIESEDSFVIFFTDEPRSEHFDADTETEESDQGSDTEDFSSLDSVIPNKKVRFAAPGKLCEVHPLIHWSFAYQAARKGPWEEYARDRDRFKHRVRRTEALIGHVLASAHRSKIFEERFCDHQN